MKAENIKPRRCLLYMPASRLEIYPKAVASGADVVCVDLEDATADDAKDAVRAETIAHFAEDKPGGTVERTVRINGLRTREGLADLIALAEAPAAPDGILIPKVKAAEEIRIARDILAPVHPDLKFHIQIETNDGLKNAHEIAKASHKVASLVFGGFDMSASLRVEPGWDALLYARQSLVHTAARANIDLLDMPFFGLDDPDGLAAETTRARDIGFTGKCAIHPKQVEIINTAFTPDADEVARAKDLIAKFEARDQAFTIIDGVIMEKPVVERLYRTIAIADRLQD